MMYSKVFENLLNGVDYQSEIKMFIAKIIKDVQETPSSDNIGKVKYLLVEALNAQVDEKDEEKKAFLFNVAQKLDECIPNEKTEKVVE